MSDGVQNVPALQVGVVKLTPQSTQPPADGNLSFDIYESSATGGPVIRDKSNIEHPIITGLGGGGIKNVAVADSPYLVQPTDLVIRVDSSGGAVEIDYPLTGGGTDGRKVEVVNLGANVVTVNGNGNNINGSSDATLTANQRIKTEWVAGFGAVAAQWVS